MIKFHEVANIFPEMEQDRFDNLKKDIEKNGLIEPIWITQDGLIIDGRHRYRACKELGIEPGFRTYDGADDNLVNFVASLNLNRRHLNASQYAMIATNIEAYIAKEAKERQRQAGGRHTDKLQNSQPLGANLHQAVVKESTSDTDVVVEADSEKGQDEKPQKKKAKKRAPKSTEVAADAIGGKASPRYIADAKKINRTGIKKDWRLKR